MKTFNRILQSFALMIILFFGNNQAKAQNTLTIDNLTAIPESLVTIEVEMDNAQAAVAFQMDVPLGSFTYVSESIRVFRDDGHTIAASIVNSNTLRIISYSGENRTYTGNSGVIATFQLNAPTTEDLYPLAIQNAVISDVAGTNILTGVNNGSVEIAKVTPDIVWPTAIDEIIYGQEVVGAGLSDGTATYNGDPVLGSFGYVNPTHMPNAGIFSAPVRFTPNNTDLYNTVDGNVNITVKRREVRVAADPNQSKVYGGANPDAYNYTITGGQLVGDDDFEGAIERQEGENVGQYIISQGTLTISPDPDNYTIDFVEDNFEILPLRVEVYVTAGQNKVYGEDDPSGFDFTFAPELVGADSWTGLLTRESGENIGLYEILIGSLSVSDGHPEGEGNNYTVAFSDGVKFEITNRLLVITANPASKIYGNEDPALDHTVNEGTLAPNDSWVGSLTREAGENAGDWEIKQGTLIIENNFGDNVLGNYSFTYHPNMLTVNKRAVEITADDKSKVYGNDDPELTWQITEGSLATAEPFSDQVVGTLSRTGNENVGSYDIQEGSLVINDGNDGNNYNLTFNDGVFQITERELKVLSFNASDKTYDANTNATITNYTINKLEDDDVTLSWTSAHYDSKHAGPNKTVTVTGISISGGAHAVNYLMSAEEPPKTIATISKRDVTVTDFSAQNKPYDGTIEVPEYNFTVNGQQGGEELLFDYIAAFDSPNVGARTVNFSFNGIIGAEDQDNYNLVTSNGTASASITAKEVIVTPTPSQSRVYDKTDIEGDDVIAFSTTGLVDGDTKETAFAGQLSREPGINATTYPITVGTLEAANYAINLQPEIYEITRRPITITAKENQSKVYGSADPTFEFDTDNVIEGDNPTGALDRANPTVQDVGTYAITQGNLTYGTNYSETFISKDFEITKASLTIKANDRVKSFGQTMSFSGTEFTVTGLRYTDDIESASISSPGASSGASVGTYDILISDAAPKDGTSLNNYAISYDNGTLTVSELEEIVIINMTAEDRGYNGLSSANITSWGELRIKDNDGVLHEIPSDKSVGLVTTGYSASFNSKMADDNRTVTVTGLSLDGVDAYQYFIDYQTTTASIQKKDLRLINFTAQGKVYDASASIDINNTGFEKHPDDFISGDLLEFTYSVEFENPTAGQDKKVLFSDIIISGGSDASNYNLLTISGEALAKITKRTLNVRPLETTKIYGESDSDFYFEITSGLQGDDNLTVVTGEMTRDKLGELDGEDVGVYAILIGTLQAEPNYSISFTSRNLTITPKGITVTPKANQFKMYGDLDPSFEYDVDGLVFDQQPEDVMTGSLNRTPAGDDVLTTYTITQGNLSAGANYTISFTPGVEFEIRPKQVIITPDDEQSKVYGEVDSPLTYTYPEGSFIGSDADNISGTLSREEGEDVGDYEILSGTLDIGLNYQMVFTSEIYLSIIPKPLVIKANDIEKPEGVKYEFAGTEFTATGLVSAFGDAIASVTLVSDGADADAEVDDYVITAKDAVPEGTTNLNNYTIDYQTGTMSVVAKTPILLEGIITNSKVYDGDRGAAISHWGSVQGVLSGDDVTVVYDDAVALFSDKNVENGKEVVITGLYITGDDIDKYIIGNQYSSANITPRPLTLSNFTATSKYFDGTSDVSGTGFEDDRIENDDLVFDYDASFASPNADEDVTVNYTNISIIGGDDMDNYNLQTTFGETSAHIFARPITITPDDDQHKVYGEVDPLLTFTFDENELVGDDQLTGELSREGGEDIGIYNILLGSLSAGSNYELVLNPGVFTIFGQVLVTVDPEEGGSVVGEGLFLTDDQVTLNATANEGYNFSGWFIGNELQEDNTTFIFDMPVNNLEIIAAFTEQPTYYTLTVNVSGEGSVDVNGNPYAEVLTFEDGESVLLRALPDAGWQFGGWSGNLTLTDEMVNIAMDKNMTITATFSEITTPQFTLTIDFVGSGTVQVNGADYTEPITVDEGTELNMEAFATEGWEFAGWSGDLQSMEDATNITMNSNMIITASFEEEVAPNEYTLTLTIVGYGSVNINGEAYTQSVVVEDGTGIELLAIADDGYQFDGWSGDLISTDEQVNITMDGDKNVTATFSEITSADTEPLSIVRVFPNPFSDYIRLTNLEHVSRVFITNLIGQVVKDINSPREVLETANLKSGVYLLIIIDKSGNRIVQRIVKE